MSASPAAPPLPSARRGLVLALGLTQTIAWASSTYLPAILAVPMGQALGISPREVFAAYSAALLLMAVLGPRVGRLVDRHGGRPVLCASNLVLAGGLLLLGLAGSPATMLFGWLMLGAGMALGLYDAAFATLVRHYGQAARGPITGITLLGGFASTIGWPLSSLMLDLWGWRGACFGWAAIQLLLALPVNLLFLPRLASAPTAEAPAGSAPQPHPPSDPPPPGGRRQLVLLAVFGAATAFVTSAMSAHLPGLLTLAGLSAGMALLAASLFGPAQVAARLFEYFVLHRRHWHPLFSARLATALQPAGALLLLAGGASPLFGCAYALLYGAGNGMITIAKGTLPLALFGPAGYGERQGWLAVSQRLMLAVAPFCFGLVMLEFGAKGALLLSAGVSLLALTALTGLRAGR